MGRFLIFLVLSAWAIALWLFACFGSDGCVPNTTRCWGSSAQICDADQNWHTLSDCEKVTGQSGGLVFRCAYSEQAAGHTCLRVQEDGGKR